MDEKHSSSRSQRFNFLRDFIQTSCYLSQEKNILELKDQILETHQEIEILDKEQSVEKQPQRIQQSSSSSQVILAINGISRNVSEGHLEEIFSNFGKVKNVRIPLDEKYKLPKDYAYVEFETKLQREDAYNYMHLGAIDGRTIKCEMISQEDLDRKKQKKLKEVARKRSHENGKEQGQHQSSSRRHWIQQQQDGKHTEQHHHHHTSLNQKNLKYKSSYLGDTNHKQQSRSHSKKKDEKGDKRPALSSKEDQKQSEQLKKQEEDVRRREKKREKEEAKEIEKMREVEKEKQKQKEERAKSKQEPQKQNQNKNQLQLNVLLHLHLQIQALHFNSLLNYYQKQLNKQNHYFLILEMLLFQHWFQHPIALLFYHMIHLLKLFHRC